LKLSDFKLLQGHCAGRKYDAYIQKSRSSPRGFRMRGCRTSDFRPWNYRFDNFAPPAHILGSLRRAYLMRAYIANVPTSRLGENGFKSVISFGAIKGPTTLIPELYVRARACVCVCVCMRGDASSDRASEYDSGIKRGLYDYSSYDSLTSSLCERQLRRRSEMKRRARERSEGEEGRTRNKREGDKMRRPCPSSAT